MLSVNNLTKIIDGVKVLDHISLELHQGEIFGLLGRNGSGKTTLLKCIQQIMRYEEGEVLFENVLVASHPLVKRKIFFMPVHTPFYDRFSYKELVRMLKPIYPDFDVTYANELLNRYELPESKKFRELSTGMKKQLSLILAFAARPAVILLDEPTDGVDAVTRHDLLQLMIDEVAERETAILITSHRLEDIERICSRIGFLEDNKLTNVMDQDELKGDYVKIQVAFEKDVNLEIREQGIPILDSTGVFYTLIVSRDEKDKMAWLKTLQPKVWHELPVNLEEIFIAKFGGKRRW